MTVNVLTVAVGHGSGPASLSWSIAQCSYGNLAVEMRTVAAPLS